ncbi:MAG: Na/Pi symporter [Verrucomicrobia bacterium]|nr:Na/Pi symporter [Verrucomicrobiota bacterium]
MRKSDLTIVIKSIGIVLSLYLFIVGIGAMGHAFKLFGREFAEAVLTATSNPLTGLFLGILATSLVQSSSTATSIIVGLVAGGAISLQGAVPMIMGANIGTTITSMLVSLGSIRRPVEFKRAFSASSLHLTFNLLGVAILLPLELSTGLLSKAAYSLSSVFQGLGGMRLSDPLKAITSPTIELLAWIVREHAFILLLLSLGLTYGMLISIVKLLKSMVLHKLEHFFDAHLFRTAGRAMLFGTLLTFAVQSSSIPTALAVPLAAAGVLKLIQIYPFSLGSNLGTTLTAILAALATGNATAITVAFAHMLFNVIGILLIWPIPYLRAIPLRIGEFMGAIAARSKFYPVVFIISLYFAIPAFILLLVHIFK